MTLRSFLFVPGDRPDRFAKALACGADALILDLEDSVVPARKAEARAAVRDFAAGNSNILVNLNGLNPPRFSAPSCSR